MCLQHILRDAALRAGLLVTAGPCMWLESVISVFFSV